MRALPRAAKQRVQAFCEAKPWRKAEFISAAQVKRRNKLRIPRAVLTRGSRPLRYFSFPRATRFAGLALGIERRVFYANTCEYHRMSALWRVKIRRHIPSMDDQSRLASNASPPKHSVRECSGNDCRAFGHFPHDRKATAHQRARSPLRISRLRKTACSFDLTH